MIRQLDEKQKVQEDGYMFPYHYLSLVEPHRGVISDFFYVVEQDTLMIKQDNKILDAGCGDGRFIYEIRNKCKNIYGVDYSENAIKFARVFNPNANLTVSNLTKLNYKDGFFDKIVAIEVLEHISKKELHEVINEFKRVLKNKGKLLITVPSINVKLTAKHYQHFDYKKNSKTIWKEL